MNKPFNNTPTIVFAALLPFLIVAAFFLYSGSAVSNQESGFDNSNWIVEMDDVTLESDSLGLLTEQLYNETRGERRAEILLPIIKEIDGKLDSAERPTPQLLTNLLRDLSVEHANPEVRHVAYSTMINALETEVAPIMAETGLATQ